jgi:uncharacterized integral membrane protein (TIGR00698 family)
MSRTTISVETISTEVVTAEIPDDTQPPQSRGIFSNEDWWSIWIGLILVAAAYALFASGSSIKWLTVTPARWTDAGSAWANFTSHIGNYVALFVVFAALFSIAIGVLKQRLAHFLPSFLILFVASIILLYIGAWDTSVRYNLEPPLVGLLLGLIISNLFKLPEWFQAGLRVEFYIKVGIVLLGATLPFTLLVWAGPVAVGQAAIVSLLTFFTIFLVGRAFGLDKRFAAVLGVGGAVCGVSAAIAVSGAVRAKREHASVAITLVVLWAIVWVFVLPFISRALGLSTGVAGAWIGTSEFADAAGVAAAQAYGDLAKNPASGISGAPEAALQAFTLMKVVGRDIWIGIWAFVLAIVATTRWERADGVAAKADAKEIWVRFPKFVIGFVIASAFVTWVASHYSLADYRKIVTPDLVAPITALRVWAFTFTFFAIGLTTRIDTLSKTGFKPFAAFTAGVAVSLVAGYVLSVHVFAPYWTALGQ